MTTEMQELVAALVGWAVALLLITFGVALLRLGRELAAILRLPRRRGAVLVARLRGLRLRRSRAIARQESGRAREATEEVRRLRAELRVVRAERDEALGRLAQAAAPPRRWRHRPVPDDRFLQAKRAFALRFHPDRVPRDAPDRALRVLVFRDYWDALRRIERG
jgi:hypothetical protein